VLELGTGKENFSWKNLAQFGQVIFVSCEKKKEKKRKEKKLCKIHKVRANDICVKYLT
jgi:hypothetical protein